MKTETNTSKEETGYYTRIDLIKAANWGQAFNCATKATIEFDNIEDMIDDIFNTGQSQTTYTKTEVIEIIEKVKDACAERAVLVHENNGYSDIMNWFDTPNGKVKVYKESITSVDLEDFVKSEIIKKDENNIESTIHS